MSIQEALVPLSAEVASDEGRLAAVPHLGSAQSTDIILPKWVYIRDGNGRYLTNRSGPVYATLTFRAGDPDPDCIFETNKTSPLWYRFVAKTGNHIMRYYSDPGWYSSDGSTTPSFNIITASGNIVYLKDNYGPSRFFSNELRDSGAPLAKDSITDSSKMEIVQAALRNEISDIQYDIAGGKVTEVATIVVLRVDMRNDSNSDAHHTVSFAYEKWAVGTWNNVAGRELGVKATFTAGVPFVADSSFKISVTPPSEHEWGGEEGVKQTVSSSVTITVPAKKKGTLTVSLKSAHITVPFTYRQKITWANGRAEDRKENGIYNNVDSLQPDLHLEWEDI